MFLGFMRILGIIFLYTWFIWPFLFVLSLAYGIVELQKNEHKTANLVLAAISLLMITSGILSYFL